MKNIDLMKYAAKTRNFELILELKNDYINWKSSNKDTSIKLWEELDSKIILNNQKFSD